MGRETRETIYMMGDQIRSHRVRGAYVQQQCDDRSRQTKHGTSEMHYSLVLSLGNDMIIRCKRWD